MASTTTTMPPAIRIEASPRAPRFSARLWPYGCPVSAGRPPRRTMKNVMCAAIAAGVVAHSLALLSDAGHMLTDAAALGLSLIALRLAARPARGALTFGLRRVEILSAQANGVTLLVLAAFIAYEAVHRLIHPPHVRAWPILGVALGGIAVNLLAARTLAGADRRSLNIEGSFQHVLVDLYA